MRCEQTAVNEFTSKWMFVRKANDVRSPADNVQFNSFQLQLRHPRELGGTNSITVAKLKNISTHDNKICF